MIRIIGKVYRIYLKLYALRQHRPMAAKGKNICPKRKE